MNAMKIITAIVFIYIIFVLFVGVPAALICTLIGKRQRIQKSLRSATLEIANSARTLSPEEFFTIRNQYKGTLYNFDFMGCYILHNLKNDKYYIGQAVHVPQRVAAHLTGRGNGDVYADYRNGDSFEIRMIDITTTKYKRLNDLERALIFTYHAYSKGYNKTRGNR